MSASVEAALGAFEAACAASERRRGVMSVEVLRLLDRFVRVVQHLVMIAAEDRTDDETPVPAAAEAAARIVRRNADQSGKERREESGSLAQEQ